MRTFPGFLSLLLSNRAEKSVVAQIFQLFIFLLKNSEKKETLLFLLLKMITPQRGSVVIVPYMFFSSLSRVFTYVLISGTKRLPFFFFYCILFEKVNSNSQITVFPSCFSKGL